MQSRSTPAPFAPLFEDLRREHGFERLRVSGSLPPELRGTLYRVGPALFSSGGTRYGHWFDGDGAMVAVRLDGAGAAAGAVRIVDTPGLRAEREAGRHLYAGFGTRGPSGGLLGERRLARRGLPRRKNPANTSAMLWRGRLYALCEAGRPVELDPDDLATLGERDLDGAVLATFSAHPRAVPSRRAQYSFGVRYGRRTELDVYELPDGASGNARRLTTLRLARPALVHDFAATERHLVFFVPPLVPRAVPLMLGLGTFAGALRWRPQLGSEVIIVPIDAPASVARFTVDAFYQWHFANAFDRGGELVVDLVRYPDDASLRWLDTIYHGRLPHEVGPRLARAIVDRATRTLAWEHLADVPCELPQVAPGVAGRAHRFVYLCGVARDARHSAAPVESVLAVDTATLVSTAWRAPAGQIPSEPLFVPRPRPRAENDGWLLSLVRDARSGESELVVLDATRLADGPVARAAFDQPLPLTFHGAWRPA